jgi:LAO/AO transport system kinase
VLTTSAQENRGLDELWARVVEHRRIMQASGEFEARRGAQAVDWMRALLQERLERVLRSDAELQNRVLGLETEVRAGRLTPALAAGQLAALMGMRPSRGDP